MTTETTTTVSSDAGRPHSQIEMWRGTQQIIVSSGPHAEEQRVRYENMGFVAIETPITHRIFDKCRYGGPRTYWEDDVTCDRCRGWQLADAKSSANARREVDLNARQRREAIVCAVDGGRKTKDGKPVSHTLCGKPLEKARQRVASKSGRFPLVTCPECWDKRPEFIRQAEAKMSS